MSTYISLAERNYTKLLEVLPCLKNDNIKIYSEGLCQPVGVDVDLDLNLDIIGVTSNYIEISLSQYFIQNGDYIANPDMTLRVFKDLSQVFPLSIREETYYQEMDNYATIEDKIDLSEFLSSWLDNLRSQYYIIEEFIE